MTISQRLLLLMTLALGALALVVGLGANKLNQVYDAANYGNINTVPSILVLSGIQRSFSTYRLNAYRYTVATDPAQRDALAAEIQTTREKLGKGFADYEPLISDAEDKRLLDAVKSAAAGYFPVVDSAVTLGREGRMSEAQAALLQGRSLGTKVTVALDAHMHYNEELGAKGAKDAESTRSNATTLFFVVAGVVFLVVGILGFTLRASLLSRLGTANELAARIASGDLRPDTAGRHLGSSDELGHLMQAMERMRADLADTVGRIIHSGEELAASSDRLSAAAQQVSVSSQNQASSTASSAAAIEQLTVSIDHVGQSADDARQRALKAEELATHSERSVAQATTQIQDVERSVDASAEEIQALSRQVQEIGNITTVIREVADQTNLLALNASIEAARAGEQGRGFAVVADEVRKLAERTSTSVREISAVIATIQQGAETAVRSMEGSRAAVDDVVSAAQGISTAMADIRHATETVQAAVEEISEALREQQGASTELARNVESIAQMSEENSAAVGSVADTAAGLVTVSSHLHAGIARFKV